MTRLRLALFLVLAAASRVSPQSYVKEAGSEHFLFLKDDGSVWAFGACWSGQLGPVIENCRYVRTPRQIPLPGKAIDIAAGIGASYVLENGAVYSWGADLHGELGSGIPFVVGKNRADRLVPAPVPGLANIIQVSASGTRAAAVQSDGAVWLWGQGFSGEMREIPAVAPARVASLPAI